MHDNAVLDELKVGGLTLRGITRGGIETCLMVPELGVMFDVGMCPPGALRYDTILVSHGHADHLGGVGYLVSQRNLMRAPPPAIHLPQEVHEPLTRILRAWAEIEGFDLKWQLHGHAPGDRFALGGGLSRGCAAICLRTTHRVPSLAWVVERTTSRLKPEYVGLPGPEIAELRRAGVDVLDAHTEPLLCVTGDTQIEFFQQHELARRCRVLVHEVTSWTDERDVEQTRRWGHTHLDELVAESEQFTGEALVLVHRSMRHSRAEAERLARTRFPAGVRDRVVVFGH
jgi:ribonuclease Z